MKLAHKILEGNVLAAARLMTDIEAAVPGAVEELKRIYPHTGKAYIVGKDIDITLNTTTTILNRMRGVKQAVKFFATEKAAMREFEAQ